ncbi:DUF2391 domain-containing protein [Natronolimnobius baerhuensis]|uniref:DUF2391 domain-containing protein n=1 Tax=Natronolimnobius baerhuensis TaxID=253108 RepID=UPI000ADE9135|nr:DUF2391 domain-containing protein [Natronolimnobius baerhuensis]
MADSAQQIVGWFLLAGPFVVTEEVWLFAENMSLLQAVATIGVVCGIGYAMLYKADTKRDPTTEQRIARIPVQSFSLMMVAFGSVTILALLFDARDTVLESVESNREIALITFKTISVGSVFNVVGAATADSVFSR